MLDIKFVRNNPDVVKQNIKNKFQDEKLPLVDEVIELDGLADLDAEDFRARNAENAVRAAGQPEQGYCYPQHHPKAMFHEDALPVGAAVYAHVAMEWLKNH
mgnify:CR=1 FL=1